MPAGHIEESGQERSRNGDVAVDVIVKSLKRRRTWSLCGRHLGRKAKAAQDAADHTHVLDERGQSYTE